MVATLPVEGREQVLRHLQRYPIPGSFLCVYMETSGFSATSATVVDHSVALVQLGGATPVIRNLARGMLRWNFSNTPAPILERLHNDLDRLRMAEPAQGTGQYPEYGSAVQHSAIDGREAVATMAASIADAILAGTPVVGHGLLSFHWNFLKPHLPVTVDEQLDSSMLLGGVVDTSHIEKLRQADEGVYAMSSVPLAEWQRNAAAIRSKSKWSLRSFMLPLYGLGVPPGTVLTADDMLIRYCEILQEWYKLGSGT